MTENNRETRQEQDARQETRALSVETGNIISGGNFGPGTVIGKGNVNANIIADEVIQSGDGSDDSAIEKFTELLEEMKVLLNDVAIKVDEDDRRDLERSLEAIEDHTNRMPEKRDNGIIVNAIDKIGDISSRVAPIAGLANSLSQIGLRLFGG